MITNPKEQKICDKYGARGADGNTSCDKCPLGKGAVSCYDFRCKANSHYNRHTREWEYD